jgi:hypothetical protein
MYLVGLREKIALFFQALFAVLFLSQLDTQPNLCEHHMCGIHSVRSPHIFAAEFVRVRADVAKRSASEAVARTPTQPPSNTPKKPALSTKPS